MTDRPPLPPFNREAAMRKVQAAEDAWNTRGPERVAGACTVDSVWGRGTPRRSHGEEITAAVAPVAPVARAARTG